MCLSSFVAKAKGNDDANDGAPIINYRSTTLLRDRRGAILDAGTPGMCCIKCAIAANGPLKIMRCNSSWKGFKRLTKTVHAVGSLLPLVLANSWQYEGLAGPYSASPFFNSWKLRVGRNGST